MDPEYKVMGFQFVVVMKAILRSEIRLSGKSATLVFGESVEIAPQ